MNEQIKMPKCEETGLVLGGVTPIPCGAPAVMLVQHRGRREGPYWMCLAHGTHNCRNRNAVEIGAIITVDDGMPFCPSCQSKGFEPKKGETATGERFLGCSFCCNDGGKS